jgi:hypothetical protein
MATDPLDEVMRLVAEGRLTVEEAAPILAALDAAPRPADDPQDQGASGSRASPGPAGPGSAGGSLRLEVREAGRQVVQLRFPLSIGRVALDRVPGLSGDQVDSVKQALQSGMKGTILEVEDGTSSVRIVVD